MKFQLKIIVLLITILTISGCSTVRTYSGEQQPPKNISILKGAWNIGLLSQTFGNVAKVDGRDVSGTDKVEILPGKHEVSAYLVILYSYGQQIAGETQSLYIITEPGHVYIVDGDWNDGNNQIWIEDEKTGKVIAGNKPK